MELVLRGMKRKYRKRRRKGEEEDDDKFTLARTRDEREESVSISDNNASIYKNALIWWFLLMVYVKNRGEILCNGIDMLCVCVCVWERVETQDR